MAKSIKRNFSFVSSVSENDATTVHCNTIKWYVSRKLISGMSPRDLVRAKEYRGGPLRSQLREIVTVTSKPEVDI